MLLMKVECYGSAVDKALRAGDETTALRMNAELLAVLKVYRELVERTRTQ